MDPFPPGADGHRPEKTADQGMGRARGHAQIPPAQIPEDGRKNGGENFGDGDIFRIDDPFPERIGDGRAQKPGAEEFEDGDKEKGRSRVQGPGYDGSNDHIGAVIEPVGELEEENNDDQEKGNDQGILFHSSGSVRSKKNLDRVKGLDAGVEGDLHPTGLAIREDNLRLPLLDRLK